MKTSKRGINDLIESEGSRLVAYKDSGGVWTIGVGHTAMAGPPKPVSGMRITKTEEAEILARDIAKFEARVNKALGSVPQHVFDGAVSFDFNTGAIHKATWVKKYLAGNMSAAEASLKQWNKVGSKVLTGLVNRRAKEADLIFRGKYATKEVIMPTVKIPSVPNNEAPKIKENFFVRFIKWLFGVK